MGAKKPKRACRLSAKKCHLSLLSILKRLKKDDLKELLSNLSDKSIDNICEVLYNITYSPISMPQRKRQTLKKLIAKHKRSYNKLTDKTTSLANRRRILRKQAGAGIFTALLSSVVPLLISLISKK